MGEVEAVSTRSVLAAAWRNPQLRRLMLSWALFNGAEWGGWLALLVYAYAHGGATAASVMVLVQLVPSCLLSPFLGAETDRHRAGRVLLVAYAAFGVTMVLLGAAMFADVPRWLIFAMAPLSQIWVALPRPAQASLLPGVVVTPAELTAANVVASWMENGSVILAPALTGVLLGLEGPALAMAVLGGAMLVGAVLILNIPGPPALADSEQSSLFTEVRNGIHAVGHEPGARLLVIVLGSQYVLIGALDVLYVVLAISVLGMGEAGAGYLNAAFGVGGVIGAGVTALLVARRRLAPALLSGLVVAALSLGVLGLYPTVISAFVLLAVAGLSRTVLDVTGRILLQRAAPPNVLAKVFSLLEALLDVGFMVGAVLVPALVAISGARLALLGTGVLFLLIGAVTFRGLWTIDVKADVPQVEIQLLKTIPIFTPLPAHVLELLARSLSPATAKAGETVITEGEPGDTYYAIASGLVHVSKDGHGVADLGRGEGFGEIALIHDVPRTATVTAVEDSAFYTLEKDQFLLGVTGHEPTARAADAVVERRLAQLQAL